ncbi:hypothetical protein [Caulobacter sp. 602-1]|uniref:hypothetical protein n=1 Tax=Caulobacter sp. 602-1 TaxID=2492472 RepID=UPI000F62EE6F|nr:hypothetical protein [Caulobacter sp. 602-1]RRN63492.1 hypothetical protein EIK80_16900 [Caulobacter sp. 602-1]
MTATARLVIDRTKASPRAVQQGQTPTPCPVADLAAEAAGILRAMKALGHTELRDADTRDLEATDFPLYREFEASLEGPSAEYVGKSLFTRLYAVKKTATHRRATSLKGALFQLYLSGNLAGYVSGSLVETKDNSRDMKTILETEETCERLLHSAIAALQPLVADDEDLAIIRPWFFDPGSDANRITDLAIERACAWPV